MGMSEREFMQREDEAQKIQIEMEKIQLAVEKELSLYGYVADDEDKEAIEELVTNLVNKAKITRGFKNMSLTEYDNAYRKVI